VHGSVVFLSSFQKNLLQLQLHRAFGASNAGEIVVKNFCSHGMENEIKQNKEIRKVWK
jgi:hypothetical protein